MVLLECFSFVFEKEFCFVLCFRVCLSGRGVVDLCLPLCLVLCFYVFLPYSLLYLCLYLLYLPVCLSLTIMQGQEGT
jgi:hypothetical protein